MTLSDIGKSIDELFKTLTDLRFQLNVFQKEEVDKRIKALKESLASLQVEEEGREKQLETMLMGEERGAYDEGYEDAEQGEPNKFDRPVEELKA